MDESGGVRLKALEDESAEPERLLADTILDNVVSKDVPGQSVSGDSPP